MAGIDLTIAEAKLTLWLAAEEKVAAGQSFAVDGRALTRANLAEIAGRIDYWNGYVQRLSRGGRSLTRVTTRD